MSTHQGQPVLFAGEPLGSGAAVVLMLHGRHAGAENILSVAPLLDRPSLTYMAPQAANSTWYPHSFLADISKNEPDLSSALGVIAALVADIEQHGISRNRIILLGFSQGACLASEFAVRNASRYGGLVAWSGGLIGPPGTRWLYPGDFAGTPVFLGCSDVDAHIPSARVEESKTVFDRMGANVTMRLYPGMGHLVSDDEIAAARTILDEAIRTVA